jgi:hypothetical protein
MVPPSGASSSRSALGSWSSTASSVLGIVFLMSVLMSSFSLSAAVAAARWSLAYGASYVWWFCARRVRAHCPASSG